MVLDSTAEGGDALVTLFSPLREFFRKGDLLLLTLCLSASGFGLLLIFSATRWEDNNKAVAVQLIGIILGVIAYVMLTFVDFQLFTEKNWKLLFCASVVLLLLLLTPLGLEVYGNRNWLQLSKIIPGFPMNLQPNELVKLPFILLLSLCIHRLQDGGHDISSIPSVFQIGGFTVFMLALIALICGDMGTCVVYMIIFITMAWAAGVKLRWFLLVGGSIVITVLILWLFVLPDTDLWDSNYIIMRFRVVLDHSLDPQDKGFQQTRSLLAIGSGQLFGQGFLNGIQTQADYSSALPARDTDFIFAVCGEEFGLVGCAVLLFLLSAIVLRCIWVGRHASSPFSAYVCMGMAGMLLAQIFLNVGMCLFILPVMGLTLPFISYGGSSIITLFAAMGIVSSVKARALPSWLRDRSQV